MSVELHIIILAAGKGKRMFSSRPKVSLLLGGKSMITHIIETVSALEPDMIHIVHGQVKPTISASCFNKHPIHWVEQKTPRGTGDAARIALKHIPDNAQVLVLCGDTPLLEKNTLKQLLHSLDRELRVLIKNASNPYGYGRIIRDDKKNIVSIIEEKEASEIEKQITEINLSIYAAPVYAIKQWIQAIPIRGSEEIYLTDIVSIAYQQGYPIYSIYSSHPWEGVGANTKTELASLERLYQAQQAAKLMNQGIQLFDPERLDIRGEVIHGEDVSIDINCIFEGHVVIGNRVHIGAFCYLKDCHISDDTIIKPYTSINGAQLGQHCEIGPYARIRPQTVLADYVKIGNFVEVKATKISQGSKCGHLSYLGNCIIGQHVNIGAGTISCNFDGTTKHTTWIEDHVFIGSGSQLVAPITIGKNSLVGAGTTVTKNVPEQHVCIRRSPQKNLASKKTIKKKLS